MTASGRHGRPQRLPVIVGVLSFLALVWAALAITGGLKLRAIRREITAAGRSLAVEQLLPPRVPEDANAATYYRRISAVMSSPAWKAHNSATRRRPADEDARVLELVREAALRDQCLFPRAYEKRPFTNRDADVDGLATCARMLVAEARALSEVGRTDEAIE